MAGLTALSWFTISTTSRASERVRTASVAAGAYTRARDAIEQLELAEHAYLINPVPKNGGVLTRSMGSVDIALAQLSASASGRDADARGRRAAGDRRAQPRRPPAGDRRRPR